MTCPACDERVRRLFESGRAVLAALRSGSVGRLEGAHRELARAVLCFDSVYESHALDCPIQPAKG